jgi:hypothetical protein
VLLILSISGIAAGAALVADTAETVVEPAVPLEADTTLTFEDVDGNGVDDDCQDAAAELNQAAVDAALLAADLDGDGTISVSEAAQTDWVGGTNCNHGGYVSTVAQGADDCDEPDETEVTPVVATEDAAVAACDDAEEATEETEDAEKPECEAPAAEPAVEEPAVEEETPVDTAPNAHGKAVSTVAQSDAVGGKNCNHGGAVSEAAKDKDHGNAGAKELRQAKELKKAHGKGNGKGKGHGPN